MSRLLTPSKYLPPPLGATVQASGVAYRVWAPAIESVRVEIQTSEKETRLLALQRDSRGFYTGFDHAGRAGDAYLYRLESKGAFPDPASRAQQTDVHGYSLVVDPKSYVWSDVNWHRPSFRDLVIYELHVGTFTWKGTFQSACEHFGSLRELGITAIEIMPIADFSGMRNWGYDGVLPYAPARCYGTPDELRALVDCAHSNGLAVILDVVYNHFGPAGNYLSYFTPHYFNVGHHTPWGDSFNFDSEMCVPVREFFVQNPLYWMEEFHIDGFRFDATHEVCDDSPLHILAEMSEAIRRNDGYVVAEDERNAEYTLRSVAEGGLGFNAVWADDFHHALRVSQTGEKSSYFADYDGSLAEVLSSLEHGWLYRGQVSRRSGLPRGTQCQHFPPERFIHCISNHDQIGNRAMGERLSQLISPAAYRTLSALLCLSPYTPLIFMGQEWAASTPFLYFTDYAAELGAQITEGRRREFSEFPEFVDAAARNQIPDPQAEKSFLSSKLQWQECEKAEHAKVRFLYSECLRLRRTISALRPVTRTGWSVHKLPWGVGKIHYKSQEAECLVIFDLSGGHTGTLGVAGDWVLLFSTEEKRFGGNGRIEFDPSSNRISFSEKGLVFLARQPPSSVGGQTFNGRSSFGGDKSSDWEK